MKKRENSDNDHNNNNEQQELQNFNQLQLDSIPSSNVPVFDPNHPLEFALNHQQELEMVEKYLADQKGKEWCGLKFKEQLLYRCVY